MLRGSEGLHHVFGREYGIFKHDLHHRMSRELRAFGPAAIEFRGTAAESALHVCTSARGRTEGAGSDQRPHSSLSAQVCV